MLFTATITKWQIDSWRRVRTTTGTQYLLNTNRLDSIRVHGSYASLFYFDNPFDQRDSGRYMEVNLSVAQLVAQMDTALTHNSITLSVYPKNDDTKTAVSTTIAVADFAFAVADENNAAHSWVTSFKSGFRGYEGDTVLVNQTVAALLALV